MFFYLRLLILFKAGDRGRLGQGEQLRPDPDLLLQAGLDQELVSICLIFFISICFIRKIFFVFLIFFISICLNIFLYLPDLLFLLDQGHESARCAALGSCGGRTLTDEGGFLNNVRDAFKNVLADFAR